MAEIHIAITRLKGWSDDLWATLRVRVKDLRATLPAGKGLQQPRAVERILQAS